MKKIILHGRKVVGGLAEGEAIVSKQAISFAGGIDHYSGTVIQKGHELRNQSLKQKVLVFPSAKGSSAWSTTAHLTRLEGNAPAAIIIGEINSRSALGTVVMHTPTVSDLDRDAVQVIESGDWVKVDADKGIVEITKHD